MRPIEMTISQTNCPRKVVAFMRQLLKDTQLMSRGAQPLVPSMTESKKEGHIVVQTMCCPTGRFQRIMQASFLRLPAHLPKAAGKLGTSGLWNFPDYALLPKCW